MRSIEVFAGAGGLALGTALVGFKHDAVLEWNRNCIASIRENQKRRTPVVRDWPDVQSVDVREVDFRPHEGIDLLSGGPPCQPFSIGGKHAGHQDHRNLFPEMVRAVREARPKAVLIENVKGLLREAFSTFFEYVLLQLQYPDLTRKKGEAWEKHLSRLERHHSRAKEPAYKVFFRKLNAANHGVPQKRERVFIVAFRADLYSGWSFPEPTHSEDALLHAKWVEGDYWKEHKVAKRNRPQTPARIKSRVSGLKGRLFAPLHQRWQTVRDAISDLPDPRLGRATPIPNHQLNPGARVYKGHTGSPLDEPAKTLKAGDHGVPGGENMLAYPDGEVRYFTVREAARLQTFPDDFVFEGAWTEAMRQLGNAVPVTLAQVVAQSIMRKLTKGKSN